MIIDSWLFHIVSLQATKRIKQIQTDRYVIIMNLGYTLYIYNYNIHCIYIYTLYVYIYIFTLYTYIYNIYTYNTYIYIYNIYIYNVYIYNVITLMFVPMFCRGHQVVLGAWDHCPEFG